MNYDYSFYPHFNPRMYSSYSQNRSKFVNRNISNYNHVNISPNTSGFRNRETRRNENKDLRNKTEHKYKERAYDNKQPSVNDNSSMLNDDTNIVFEIFGIKLHYDDILLICLIFFLYNEGVKDESLFIALILLLLS